MADEVKLEPCPFCGGEAELDTSQAYRALSGGSLGSRAVVYCTGCGADMGFCYEDARGTPREDIVNQVVDDWNRRSPSPAPNMREAATSIDPIIAWMVEHGWLDADAEYYTADLIAALNDNAGPDMREAVEALKAEADGAYIKYINLMSKPECQGEEAKLQTGRFGSAELDAHRKARELLGIHVGMHKVLAALRSLTGAKP